MKTAPDLASLQQNLSSASKDTKQIILDLLTNASDSLIKQASSQVQDLEQSIKSVESKYGASWEDIVIHFEWIN